MRTLGIDTATHPGSLAVLDQDQVLAAHSFAADERPAELIAARLQELLRSISWRVSDLELLALVIGPGSFTGLRVGVTMVKLLAYATGCRVQPICTHEAIAAGIRKRGRKGRCHLWTVIDSQRNGLHVGHFQVQPTGAVLSRTSPRLYSVVDFLERLSPGDVVTGPGLNRISKCIPPQVEILPPFLWDPLAEVVARLAQHATKTMPPADIWHLLPAYANPSSAEQVRSQVDSI